MMLKWRSYLIIHTSWIIHKQYKVTFFLFLYCTKKIFSLHTNFEKSYSKMFYQTFEKTLPPKSFHGTSIFLYPLKHVFRGYRKRPVATNGTTCSFPESQQPFSQEKLFPYYFSNHFAMPNKFYERFLMTLVAFLTKMDGKARTRNWLIKQNKQIA